MYETTSLIGLMAVMNMLFGIVNYVLSALAIYKIAKVEKVKYPWLAWIPFANSYMVIKVAGGNMIMIILAIVSFITGSVSTTIVDNMAFTIIGAIVSVAWSIYAITLYNRLCDRYNVNIMLFVASFLAPVALYIRVLATFYIPLLLIGFYAHYKLYKNAVKGPSTKVKVQSRMVLSNKKKKKK